MQDFFWQSFKNTRHYEKALNEVKWLAQNLSHWKRVLVMLT